MAERSDIPQEVTIDTSDYGVELHCPYRRTIEANFSGLHPDGYQFEENIAFLSDFKQEQEKNKCQYLQDGICKLASFAIHIAPEGYI